ncbi:MULTISPECIES: hypothetical protein [Kamptonema]|uniref:hypothetical protein n=1 Tax=Kamptonema TaxID=1501433 RepID=UPI0001DAC79D|nr:MULTISPECIES: hypothetical protein [Kamptonema]CBN53812.1 hypothetical protein OSCI_270003 [Kamptonema sp. PCC 6506]
MGRDNSLLFLCSAIGVGPELLPSLPISFSGGRRWRRDELVGLPPLLDFEGLESDSEEEDTTENIDLVGNRSATPNSFTT